jgi:hypothetical protein
MKIRPFYQRIILTVLALTPMTTFAKNEGGDNGSGTRGGGEAIVDVSGIPQLRDLADGSACYWKDSKDFVKSRAPLLPQVMQSLAALDWYFAKDLQMEIDSLVFCETAHLRSLIFANDDPWYERVNRLPRDPKVQIGIRINQDVFADVSTLTKMDDLNRAMFVIHEAMHSYFPYNMELRMTKLRSVVASIARAHRGEIVSRRALHLQLEQNKINFPLTVSVLEPFRAQIEYLLSSVEERETYLESLKTPEARELFMQGFAIIPKSELAVWHQSEVKYMGFEFQDQLIQRDCEQADVAALDRRIKSGTADTFKIVSQCFESMGPSLVGKTATRVLLETWMNQNLKKWTDDLMFRLADRRVFMKAGLLYPTSGAVWVALNRENKMDYPLITFMSAGNSMTSDQKSVFKMLAFLYQRGNAAQAEKIIFGHPRFDQSFSIHGLKIQAETHSQNAEEYSNYTEVLERIHSLYWGYGVEVGAQALDSAQQEAFRKWSITKVDSKNLGYRVR